MAKKFFITTKLPTPPEFIERRIYLVRGQKVMLDSDLAELYGITTGNFNLAVKRNKNRFPKDFMFQLNKEETSLLLQIAIAKSGRGGRQTQPYAFTELGVAMLSSILNSDRAVQMNIFIMRAFVKLREVVASHKDLANKIEQLERNQKEQGVVLALVANDVRTLSKKLNSPKKTMSKIGFRSE